MDRRGFTLIELLFVVFIIGILASIILANYGPARQRARDSQRISDISQIQVALEAYFENPSTAVPGNNGPSYPPYGSVGATSATPPQPVLPCQPYVTGNFSSFAPGGLNCLVPASGNASATYLPSIPIDPQTHTPYSDYYSCDPTATNQSCKNTDTGAFYQHYCMGANLENANAQATAENAATASCAGVTWCPYLSTYTGTIPAKPAQPDNYVVCR